jgi:hypothetical protein
MTDEQFKAIMAMQLAQVALLQSIEVNTASMAMQTAKNAVHYNWKDAHSMFEQGLKQVKPHAA